MSAGEDLAGSRAAPLVVHAEGDRFPGRCRAGALLLASRSGRREDAVEDKLLRAGGERRSLARRARAERPQPEAIDEPVRQPIRRLRERERVHHEHEPVRPLGETDAGQAVYAGASEALQALSDLTEQIMLGRARSSLVISVITSVAERWLQSRLATFAL